MAMLYCLYIIVLLFGTTFCSSEYLIDSLDDSKSSIVSAQTNSSNLTDNTQAISTQMKKFADIFEDNDDEKNGGESNIPSVDGRQARMSSTGDIKADNIFDLLSESHMQFTLDLLNALILTEGLDQTDSLNPVLLSPASIQTVLMMIHLGSRAKTRQEISQCLHFPSAINTNKLHRRHDDPKIRSRNNNSSSISLASIHESFADAIKSILHDPALKSVFTLANQVFYQETLALSQQYESALKYYYSTQMRAIDFQSGQSPSVDKGSANETSIQDFINDWIEKQTKGRIVKFLTSPISPATLLMAINVLHFKGEWQYRFDSSDTEPDATFKLHDGKKVKVPMMVGKLPVAYAQDSNLKVSILELPYKVQRLALFLILPDEHNGIPATIRALNSTVLTRLIRTMRKSTPDQGGINVRIPKFTLDSTPQLTQILSYQLGLRSLFSANMADLSGMFSTPKLQSKKVAQSKLGDEQQDELKLTTSPIASLDEIVHKAILEVDEMGSVGTAASATIVERVGVFNGQYFEAEHAFLMFLIDKQSGLILFSGLYAGPAGS